MHDPFVEYYIVESFGTYNPSSGLAKKLDSINVDGGTYDTYKNTRIIYSLDGTSVLQQLYSIRQQKRVGGTINAQAHFDAWAKTGQKLGKHSFQILSTEGYRSSGSASITVQGS
jgi:endo-1,4-beta-xylanase